MKKRHSVEQTIRILSRTEGDSTDDVTLVINAGHKVKIVEGDYRNIKLTTTADLKFAETILMDN